MRRVLTRRQLSRLHIWTDEDGPVPAREGDVGVEYRGRLGHPSSYGLLVGHAAAGLKDCAALGPMPGTLEVPCDHVTLGLTEPEYRGALGAAMTLLPSRLVVTGIAEGRYGSSSVVFAKLAAVLSVVLRVGAETVDETRVWATWDEPWRALPGA